MYHYVINFSGELSLKSKGTRNRFMDRLMHNLADALKGERIEYRLHRQWSRIRIESESSRVPEVASRVFGVQSVAIAEKKPWSTLEDLVEVGAEHFRSVVEGKTFAVRAKRGEQASRIPFRSPELERKLGAALAPFASGVDLQHPDVVARVELHGQDAFFFSSSVPGKGGLPIGAEGRALTLFSGGFDSPVAAWSLLRRGVKQDFLFCNLGGGKHTREVISVAKALVDRWCSGYRPKLFIVDFQPVVEDLKANSPGPLWQVLLKRRMLTVADRMAEFLKASALITGEAVGQVSSQTLQNLDVITRAAERPVLRPMVAWNKEEIIDIARQIGTHDVSAVIPEYCGLHAGTGPAIYARLDEVEAAEKRLDDELLRRVLKERMIIDVRALDLKSLEAVDLEVDSVPDDAQLVDLRSEAAYAAWHPEGAIRHPYPDILRYLNNFERDKSYVIFCEIGLKSAHLAEVMNRAGFRAFHLKKGVQTLRKAETAEDPALAALLSPVLRDSATESPKT